MRTAFYYALAVLLGLAFGIVGCFIWKGNGTLMCLSTDACRNRTSCARTTTAPPSLDELQVTVIRVGTDVTLLLDWERKQHSKPFHIWVEVDGSHVVLTSPDDEPRTIEVVPEAELLLYGSTLYHELADNRLAIDLQVKHTDQKEQPQ